MKQGYPEPAALAWLAIILILVGFESWAVVTHHHTMSEWLRGWVKNPLIWWLGFGTFVYLIYHFFFVPR